MAKEEKFILVNLEEDKAKELAQTISNETSRKILDYLSNREDASEVDISKALDLPISTVHYNIQALKDVSLIEAKQFVWSEKGKVQKLYKIAKKLIIIAPSGTKTNFRTQLRNILPVTLISAVGAGFIYLISNNLYGGLAKSTLADTTFTGPSTGESAAAAPLETATEVIKAEPNIALWFLAGALFAIILYSIISNVRKKG